MEVNSKVARAYQAALDAFNTGNWDAAVLSCGKVLEEIAKTELPYNERGGTLGQLLDKLSKHIRLEQPVADLAAAVKDSKSLGGYFDLERENDPELAQATVSLVEAFITYTYLFKAKVQRLRQLMGNRKVTKVKVMQDDPSPSPTPTAVSQPHNPSQEDVSAKKGSEFDNFEVNSGPMDAKRGNWNAFGDSKD
jgi:HEPN domain-containing protein